MLNMLRLYVAADSLSNVNVSRVASDRDKVQQRMQCTCPTQLRIARLALPGGIPRLEGKCLDSIV